QNFVVDENACPRKIPAKKFGAIIPKNLWVKIRRTEGDVRDPLALSWPDISRWPYFPLKPLASPHSVMRYRAAVDARISFCLDVMLELFAMLVVYLYID
ncbi:MAG: hypothetical protein C7B43_21280, partial [Sulfobacillus benefaciens]